MTSVHRLHGSSDADPPREPHFVCPDGYAWIGDRGRACALSDGQRLLAPAELVSRAVDGEPLERALACAEIARDYGEQALRLLYPPRCRGCGRDHWATDGKRLLRSGQAVHPGAVDHLRRARLPMRAFRVPDVPEGKKKEGARHGYSGLPIRATPEATLAAQVAYAIKQSATRDPMVRFVGKKRRGGDRG